MDSTRPTRSQQTLLSFIDSFVKQHGFGPSYREIMRALDYKSVSTVAIHINGLIAKGQLRKQGRSARSLEVLPVHIEESLQKDTHEAWLIKKVETYAVSPGADKQTLHDIAEVCRILRLPEAQAKTQSYLQ